MAAPSPSWSVVPVYGVYTNPMDGSPVTGSIKLTIQNRVVSATDGEIFPEGSTQTVALGTETGSVSVNLPAVDDPDISPDNWSIKIEEKFTGLTGRTYYIQPTLAMLELDPPGLNLCTIILDDNNSKPTIAEMKGVPGGVAALNDQGKVVDASGNVVGGGSGGGSVDTVNGVAPDAEGNVSIDRGDIGLDLVDNTADLNKSVASAAKLTTERTIQFTGAVTGEFGFDGTSDESVVMTFAGGGATGNDLVAAATTADAWTTLGTVPTDNLPALAINDTFTVANQAARLGLTAQRGDMAYQTDTSTWYILATDTPAVDANWKAISVPAVVQSVNGKTGAVALTASDVGVTAATTSSAGIVELAASDDTSSTDKAVTPASLGSVAATKQTVDSNGAMTRFRGFVSTQPANLLVGDYWFLVG